MAGYFRNTLKKLVRIVLTMASLKVTRLVTRDRLAVVILSPDFEAFRVRQKMNLHDRDAISKMRSQYF